MDTGIREHMLWMGDGEYIPLGAGDFRANPKPRSNPNYSDHPVRMGGDWSWCPVPPAVRAITRGDRKWREFCNTNAPPYGPHHAEYMAMRGAQRAELKALPDGNPVHGRAPGAVVDGGYETWSGTYRPAGKYPAWASVPDTSKSEVSYTACQGAILNPPAYARTLEGA